MSTTTRALLTLGVLWGAVGVVICAIGARTVRNERVQDLCWRVIGAWLMATAVLILAGLLIAIWTT